jgi:hypothetical protein
MCEGDFILRLVFAVLGPDHIEVVGAEDVQGIPDRLDRDFTTRVDGGYR